MAKVKGPKEFKDEYKVTMVLRNVTRGDVLDLCQNIWDENANDLDAVAGDFTMRVKYMGEEVAWGGKDDSGMYDEFDEVIQ